MIFRMIQKDSVENPVSITIRKIIITGLDLLVKNSLKIDFQVKNLRNFVLKIMQIMLDLTLRAVMQ